MGPTPYSFIKHKNKKVHVPNMQHNTLKIFLENYVVLFSLCPLILVFFFCNFVLLSFCHFCPFCPSCPFYPLSRWSVGMLVPWSFSPFILLYTIHYKLYKLCYILYIVHCTLHTLHFTLSTIHNILYIMHLHFTLCPLCYTIYTIN